MIYFMCYPRGNESRVTVVDLREGSLYEIDEWRRPDDETFASRDEAIMHARNFAFNHNKEYVLFNSRYDESMNEYNGEFEGDAPNGSDLESLLLSVKDSDYIQLIEDIRSNRLDSVGAVRLRLYRILKGE